MRLLRSTRFPALILLLAAVIGLVIANSGWGEAAAGLKEAHVGIPGVIDLSIGHWISDGLLAIFFFGAGLELKREFVAGDLRDPRRAALPVVAAVGGMAAPALVFVAWNLGGGFTYKAFTLDLRWSDTDLGKSGGANSECARFWVGGPATSGWCNSTFAAKLSFDLLASALK